MLWGDGWQAPATAQMRLIWACPTGTGGLSGGRDGLVIGALGETGQLKKGEGAGYRRLLGGVRRWHRVAARAQRGVTLVGKQFVDSKTMQAGSLGYSAAIGFVAEIFREIRPY
jgi:hypothetical protein